LAGPIDPRPGGCGSVKQARRIGKNTINIDADPKQSDSLLEIRNRYLAKPTSNGKERACLGKRSLPNGHGAGN